MKDAPIKRFSVDYELPFSSSPAEIAAVSAANPSLRAIPSVEKILKRLEGNPLPRALKVEVVRHELERIRKENSVPDEVDVISRMNHRVSELYRTRIQPVINGTGILLHTNLGRAPLGPEAIDSLTEIGSRYSNLEFDIATGKRGRRASYLERCLASLCNAEAATIVNNCAAALVLILRHLTADRRKEIIISRGELVQIGGGFRIPDILETSGAVLKEVGTTNQTTLDDYRAGLAEGVALILRVHQSNFFMDGFVNSPDDTAVANLAREAGVPFVVDLGSGAMVDSEQWARLDPEPTPRQVLKAGANLVCFSGDKLLGGPQAGIIAGNGDLVRQLKGDAFFRALRCDKLILAALQTTAETYLIGLQGESDAALDQIPVLHLLRVSCDELRVRGAALMEALSNLPASVTLGQSENEIGGGTLPKSRIDSVTINIVPEKVSLEQLAQRLRDGTPAVIGYVAHGELRLDLRTIFPNQDAQLKAALVPALNVDR